MQTPKIQWAFLLLLCTFLSTVAANAQPGFIKGKVMEAETKQVMEFVSIEIRSLKDSSFVTGGITDAKGIFLLKVKTPGNYHVIANHIGYATESRVVSIRGKEESVLFSLKEDAVSLKEVVVRGLNEGERVSRLAYNVQIMETERLKNTTLDLAQAMDKINGVKIREEGGVGSDISVNLNGFSGKHIKVFIDGVPMEGMGSAFGLNNMPAGTAKRIEVYKGVVPIWLGGDALGGAINIVTDQSNRTRVNASYSYGSFNTHKSSVYAEHTTRQGLYASLNLYQNYSDNDYWVDARILDLENGKYSNGTQRVRRFNGMYHNEAAVAKVGLVNKSFADKLLLGFVLGNEYKQIQNASDMNFVYGERYNTATTLLPSLTYEKRFNVKKGLFVGLNGNYNFGKSYASDTASRRYNWLGEYINKSTPGELSHLKYHYKNRNGAANLNVGFYPASHHAIQLSSTLSTFSRKGYNEVSPQESDQYPAESYKTITGLSYKYDHNDIWNTSVFVKNYLNYQQAYMIPENETEYRFYDATQSYWGGGAAMTLFLGKRTQLKASYEHTYRLPTSKELFGSGDGLELGTNTLRPESSDNYNIGAAFRPVSNTIHQWSVDMTFMYRNVNDYIRRTINQTKGTASSTNDGKVRSIGGDLGTHYDYKNLFFAGANFSYFDMRNMTRYKTGTIVESTIYKDRIPNQPYMYGNADAGVHLHNIGLKGSSLTIHYMLNFVDQFYFDWPSYGGITIPQQFSHDLFVSYDFGSKHKFALSLECRNLLDENLYDNFSLQKPGRSFAIKVGYNFNN